MTEPTPCMNAAKTVNDKHRQWHNARATAAGIASAVVAIAATLLVMGPAGHARAACLLEGTQRHIVVAVIDAATVRIETGVTVRLLGFHPPRAADVGANGPWPPERAAQAALSDMVLNKSVDLRFDKLRQDRHGRTLAHLFLNDQPELHPASIVEGPGRWLQARLVAEGHGRVVASTDNQHCASELLEHERSARQLGKGMWSNPAYRLRDARQSGSLALAHGTFQIVTGAVHRVRKRGETTEIELSAVPYRRTVFRYRHDNRALLGAMEGDPLRLKGQRLEVRGWILREQGVNGRRRDVVIDATVQGWAAIAAPTDRAPATDRPAEETRPRRSNLGGD